MQLEYIENYVTSYVNKTVTFSGNKVISYRKWVRGVRLLALLKKLGSQVSH